jgi:hypothetical protein
MPSDALQENRNRGDTQTTSCRLEELPRSLKRRGDEMTSDGDELRRRLATWNEVITMDREDLDPRFLRARGIYGGAQGIWVDKANTASVSQDGRGVTVSILHTGRH